jgi:hypothetical protein
MKTIQRQLKIIRTGATYRYFVDATELTPTEYVILENTAISRILDKPYALKDGSVVMTSHDTFEIIDVKYRHDLVGEINHDLVGEIKLAEEK